MPTQRPNQLQRPRSWSLAADRRRAQQALRRPLVVLIVGAVVLLVALVTVVILIVMDHQRHHLTNCGDDGGDLGEPCKGNAAAPELNKEDCSPDRMATSNRLVRASLRSLPEPPSKRYHRRRREPHQPKRRLTAEEVSAILHPDLGNSGPENMHVPQSDYMDSSPSSDDDGSDNDNDKERASSAPLHSAGQVDGPEMAKDDSIVEEEENAVSSSLDDDDDDTAVMRNSANSESLQQMVSGVPDELMPRREQALHQPPSSPLAGHVGRPGGVTLSDYLSDLDDLALAEVRHYMQGTREDLSPATISSFRTKYGDLSGMVKKFYPALGKLTRYLTSGQVSSIKTSALSLVVWGELAASPLAADDPLHPCKATFSAHQASLLPLEQFIRACQHLPLPIT
jgi:hypothetical protein